EPFDGQQLAACIEAHEGEHVVQQRGRVRRAGSRQRRAEGIEVQAVAGAGRAGRRVAIRPAEAAYREIEAVYEHVGRTDEELVLAELSAELPDPHVVDVAGQRPRQAARVA